MAKTPRSTASKSNALAWQAIAASGIDGEIVSGSVIEYYVTAGPGAGDTRLAHVRGASAHSYALDVIEPMGEDGRYGLTRTLVPAGFCVPTLLDGQGIPGLLDQLFRPRGDRKRELDLKKVADPSYRSLSEQYAMGLDVSELMSMLWMLLNRFGCFYFETFLANKPSHAGSKPVLSWSKLFDWRRQMDKIPVLATIDWLLPCIGVRAGGAVGLLTALLSAHEPQANAGASAGAVMLGLAIGWQQVAAYTSLADERSPLASIRARFLRLGLSIDQSGEAGIPGFWLRQDPEGRTGIPSVPETGDLHRSLAKAEVMERLPKLRYTDLFKFRDDERLCYSLGISADEFRTILLAAWQRTFIEGHTVLDPFVSKPTRSAADSWFDADDRAAAWPIVRQHLVERPALNLIFKLYQCTPDGFRYRAGLSSDQRQELDETVRAILVSPAGAKVLRAIGEEDASVLARYPELARIVSSLPAP